MFSHSLWRISHLYPWTGNVNESETAKLVDLQQVALISRKMFVSQQLSESQKESFQQVFHEVDDYIYISFNNIFHLDKIQFVGNVKDCQLIDSSDDYLLKWLVGKL